MLQQPTAERVACRQATANPLLNAQPHCTEESTHCSDANVGATTGLAVVGLTVFNADCLQLINLELQDLQCWRHERYQRPLLIALEDHSRVTQPANVLHGQVGDGRVYIVSVARYFMAGDILDA